MTTSSLLPSKLSGRDDIYRTQLSSHVFKIIEAETNIEIFSNTRFSEHRKDRLEDNSWNYICRNFILIPDKQALVYTEELHAHSTHFEFSLLFFDEHSYYQTYNEFLKCEEKLYYECIQRFSEKRIKFSIRAGVTLPNEPEQILDKRVFRFYNEFRYVDFFYGITYLTEEQRKWLYKNIDLFA